MTRELIHPKYRPDIDGLRAIAILAVVLFHAFPEFIKGGFIGVDIFFVISGYLISTIIFDNIKNNSFSFLEFYSRRIRRIFPALLVILITTYAIGWFLLFSSEYAQLGYHIFTGSFFISNFAYWYEIGYFDTEANYKILLHLWSLSIEEQFYLIWPFVVWFLFKMQIRILFCVFVLGISSFILNIYMAEGYGAAAFFLPHTRFWELFIGAGLAYRKEIKYFPYKNIISFIGSILIISGLILITKDSTFPGYWALLPTIGTAFIIAGNNESWLNRNFLSNKILIWFGLISFPLYLWHWPLLSLIEIVTGETPNIYTRVIVVFTSIILAWLTNKFIEQPIRFGKNLKTKTTLLLIALVIIGFIGTLTYTGKGFLFRNIVKENEFNDQQLIWKNKNTQTCDNLINKSLIDTQLESCKIFGNPTNIKVVLMGDSIANSLSFGLAKLYANEQNGMINFMTPGCAPFHGNSTNSKCQKITNQAYDFVLNNASVETVIMGFYSTNIKKIFDKEFVKNLTPEEIMQKASSYMQKDIDTIKNAGKKLVITFDIPFFPTQAINCLDRNFFSIVKNCEFKKSTIDRIDDRIAYLQLYKNFFSDKDVCIFYQSELLEKNNIFNFVDESGHLLMRDIVHLSNYGSEQMALLFKQSRCYQPID